MPNTYSKLDQAVMDLIEAYSELEGELEEKYGDDQEAYQTGIIEALETSIETAAEEQDISTASFATLLSCFSEALEQLDPSAFEDEEEEEDEESDYDLDDDTDIDLDDDDEEVEAEDDADDE